MRSVLGALASVRSRKIAIVLFGFLLLLGLPVFIFNLSCKGVSDFTAVTDPGQTERLSVTRSISEYARPVESTYLTFPEWWIVYSSQEYADHIHIKNPSTFPYFGSIRQYWSGYCTMFGVTKQLGKFNAGDHLMLAVIGMSYSVENAVKGIYEHTIGRVTEWSSRSPQTTEDVYAAQTASDYVDYIRDHPFYEFSYGPKFVGVWRNTSLFGPHIFRKWERKALLSIEYGIKTVYFGLIKLATKAIYGSADTRMYAWITASKDILDVYPSIHIEQNPRIGQYIITMPRYEEFRDLASQLALQGAEFVDIAGNLEITLSVVVPIGFEYNVPRTHILFTQIILTDSSHARLVVRTPVSELHTVLRYAQEQQLQLEHIYDY